MASNRKDKTSDKKPHLNHSDYNTEDESSHTNFSYAPKATIITSEADKKSSYPKASPAFRVTSIFDTPEEFEPPVEIAEPEGSEKPVATYEFVWHYDHNPVYLPREITQSYWKSHSKELVRFYAIDQPKTDSNDNGDETDDKDTWSPTHRAEVRILRNNEKRVTFDCHFQENSEVLKDVRFIKSESIKMDGSKWPFFEDSRSLEDLDLRLRDERDANGYYYIEFVVRQKTHRDSSDMPHLTVLGRRVVDDDKPLEFSEEEALRLVRRKTPEPYEVEDTPGLDDATKNDKDFGTHDLTAIEEGFEINDTAEHEDGKGW